MPKPFLSIGIIFRDDIRCLERCLSSLAPLREAIPSELVMADTGSVDGSRAVAEKYADILFDFPWVNDFSAARNAVMDRCTGRWYLTVDTDEWLDEDIKELVSFIRANNRKAGEVCLVCVRNYKSLDDAQEYRDFMAARMLRMSTGLRYQGPIHESWAHGDGRPMRADVLAKTILHHDGYLYANEESFEAKQKRNMELLLRELEKEPENLGILLQCIDISSPGSGREDFIRRGIEGTEAKGKNWERFGPAIFRYAVTEAQEKRQEENMLKWSARAEELFPNSFYTLIDIHYVIFLYHWEKNNYDECIRLGESYLKAVADCRAGRGDHMALTSNTLRFASFRWERGLRIVLAHAYFRTGQPKRAVKILDTVDFSLMDGEQTQNSVLLLGDLQKDTTIDTAPLILRLYEGICKPTPSEERAEERKEIFSKVASNLFSSIAEEEKSENFKRWSCSLLAPLAGQHPLGDAAVVLAAETAPEKERLLFAADKPYTMPREVLRRAILSGVSFPLRDKPLNVEETEAMAVQLAQKDGLGILKLAVDHMDAGSQQLIWAVSVALAIVGAWEWADDGQGMDLARTFARVEEAFLPRCYTPEMLCEENILILPPMHRFGWYCAKAFQALDSGDAAGYVQLLRAGLNRCPRMKAMVEYLARYTPRTPNPSRELLELAEKVRTLLSAYDPEDPAVAALKQSPIYQEVAYLIEGIEAPIMGGLAQ